MTDTIKAEIIGLLFYCFQISICAITIWKNWILRRSLNLISKQHQYQILINKTILLFLIIIDILIIELIYAKYVHFVNKSIQYLVYVFSITFILNICHAINHFVSHNSYHHIIHWFFYMVHVILKQLTVIVVYISFAHINSLWFYVHPGQLNALSKQSETLLTAFHRNNINYYLVQSSLLNAVRDKGKRSMMPWEFDEDLCVDMANRNDIIQIINEFGWDLNVAMTLITVASDYSYFSNDAEIAFHIHLGISYPCNNKYYQKDTVSLTKYGDIFAYIPKDYDQWLTNYYGDDWRTPKVTPGYNNGVKYNKYFFLSNNRFWFHSYASYTIFYVFMAFYIFVFIQSVSEYIIYQKFICCSGKRRELVGYLERIKIY